jgi:hypothetical protein
MRLATRSTRTNTGAISKQRSRFHNAKRRRGNRFAMPLSGGQLSECFPHGGESALNIQSQLPKTLLISLPGEFIRFRGLNHEANQISDLRTFAFFLGIWRA